MPTVLIALGSNVGDRRRHLQDAINELSNYFSVQAVSPIYETAPMYLTDQPAFYNAAVRVSTNLAPLTVLHRLKEIERIVGRKISPRFGPREIDLDLVGYGRTAYRYSEHHQIKLQVPHPRTSERRFVLAPLADIVPEFLLVGIGVVSKLLLETESQANTVQRIDDAVLSI